MRAELPRFQSLNWQAHWLLARAELYCGLPFKSSGAAMSQQRAVESLPRAGPPETGTHLVVGAVAPFALVPRK